MQANDLLKFPIGEIRRKHEKAFNDCLDIAFGLFVAAFGFAEGWVINEDTNTTKYQKADGEYAADEWQTIDGKQYYFRTTGEMAKGWVKTAVIGTTATKKPENGVMKIWPPT